MKKVLTLRVLIAILAVSCNSALCAQGANPFLQGSRPAAGDANAAGDASTAAGDATTTSGGDASESGAKPGDSNPDAVIQSGIPLPAFLIDVQRNLHNILSTATKQIQGDSGSYNWSALFVVLLAAFGYGVFHALGPGHGKALVATLFVSRQAKIRQSLSLGYLIALIHAVVAISVVLIILYGLQALFMTSFEVASHWTTVVSYGVVVVLGLFMCIGAIVEAASGGKRHLHFHIHLPSWFPGASKTRHSHDHEGHNPEHHAEHAHEHHEHSHDVHDHGEHGRHERTHDTHSSGPAGGHTPAAAETAEPVKSAEIFATAFASSIIPCPGAATIMVFSVSLGLPLVGALAVTALSIGMGITTSLVGLMAILVQRGVVKSASLGGAKTARVVASVLRVAGTAFLFLLGSVLLLGELA